MPFATKAIRDRARKRIAQRVKAGEPCCFCHQSIDLAIPYPDPMSFTVDHATPTSLGGTDHYDGLRPSHFSCNVKRSNSPDGTVGRNSGALDGVGQSPPTPGTSDPPRRRDQSGASIFPWSGKASA